MSPNAPLTDEQRNSVAEFRATLSGLMNVLPLGTAESVEARARRPDPENLSADVAVRIEIAPPCSQPHPLLANTGVVKTPERVPIYFFALHDDREESASDTELANTRIVFFIHGGGNVTGHPTHLPFIQFYTQLLRAIAAQTGDSKTKYVLVAPSYRLATVPENAFPAALQDLVAAYDYVLGKGYDASNMFVAGDSAGGNYALVLTHLVLQSNRPAPRGLVAIAPSSIMMSDQTSERAEMLAGEDILGASTYKAMTSAYVGNSGISLSDPLVSSGFLPFDGSWPKTLILVGTSDHLIDAAREVAGRLTAVGRPVELVEYKERPHGWWVMPNVFPENIQDAVERIARFVSAD